MRGGRSASPGDERRARSRRCAGPGGGAVGPHAREGGARGASAPRRGAVGGRGRGVGGAVGVGGGDGAGGRVGVAGAGGCRGRGGWGFFVVDYKRPPTTFGGYG